MTETHARLRALPLALQDAIHARDHLLNARRGYHLAVVIASDRGHSAAEIADALDTKPLYIANTLTMHRTRKCYCQSQAVPE